MSTDPKLAAALDAAALRAVTLEVEAAVMRELRTAGRIEDAPAARLRLPEFSGGRIEGHGWLTIRTRGVTVGAMGGGPHALVWTAERAIAAVLTMRADDPQGAHARDLARADDLVRWWRFCFEGAVRRLAVCGPEYRYGDVRGAPVFGRETYPPGCPLGQRESYGRLIALAIDARARLAEAGPAWSTQQSLF